ncbi:MAG: sulfite exporter TauE/SafE family protein, partial [Cyanobacteria bacterium P01_D01_bin.73]
PAALTSFDRAKQNLGKNWRRLHLLSYPAFLLAAGHTVFSGSSYLGQLDLATINWTRTFGVGVFVALVILWRWLKPKVPIQRS